MAPSFYNRQKIEIKLLHCIRYSVVSITESLILKIKTNFKIIHVSVAVKSAN